MKNIYEEHEMSDSNNFSFSDALLTQAMSSYGGGNRGGSGGQWFGGGCCPPMAPYADLATVQHGLIANRDIYAVGNRAVLDNQETIQRADGTRQICDALGAQNNTAGQNMLQLNGAMADGRAETASGFSSVLLEFCRCCKDGQILTIQENCKTRELINERMNGMEKLFLETELKKATDTNNVNSTVSRVLEALKAAHH